MAAEASSGCYVCGVGAQRCEVQGLCTPRRSLKRERGVGWGGVSCGAPQDSQYKECNAVGSEQGAAVDGSDASYMTADGSDQIVVGKLQEGRGLGRTPHLYSSMQLKSPGCLPHTIAMPPLLAPEAWAQGEAEGSYWGLRGKNGRGPGREGPIGRGPGRMGGQRQCCGSLRAEEEQRTSTAAGCSRVQNGCIKILECMHE